MSDLIPDLRPEVFQTCSENKYNSYESLIENHTLMRIISGGMTVVQSDRTYVLNAGDTLLFPRNQLAKAIKYPQDEKSFKCVTILINQEAIQNYYALYPFVITKQSTQKIRFFAPHLLLDSIFNSLSFYFEMADALPLEISEMKIQEAIAILYAIDKSIFDFLGHFDEPGKIGLRDFMEKNYMFNMSMEKFGYLTGRSLTTFQRDFRRIFNTTPQRWLTAKRLEIANYEIFEKRRKPSDVYFEVGFENLSSFSFAFKKHFGYNPTALKTVF